MFHPVRQVAALVGRQTTFGRDRQGGGTGKKSAFSNCISLERFNWGSGPSKYATKFYKAGYPFKNSIVIVRWCQYTQKRLGYQFVNVSVK